MIQLLVVDDHPAYRRGPELMLAGSADIEIVGEGDYARNDLATHAASGSAQVMTGSLPVPFTGTGWPVCPVSSCSHGS
ncbi:hypothetical protein [Dactylosporangium sp. NPDC051541]|uniref:hypothetical protein n=1 Tax=Dactylosporangium sp. NPDC051541 TaxID=3363977 RepID=UPI0037878E15